MNPTDDDMTYYRPASQLAYTSDAPSQGVLSVMDLFNNNDDLDAGAEKLVVDQSPVHTPATSKKGLEQRQLRGSGGLTFAPVFGVPDEVAVNKISLRWSTHGNVETDALRATWRQAIRAMNRKLQEVGTSASRDWHVLSPGTGTGKTESAIVYASLLHRFAPSVGMMIVARRIAAAQQLVEHINLEAGIDVAAAHNSETKLDAETMKRFQVLVITHEAFERAVEKTDSGRVWDQLVAFGDTGARSLVVIDEAVDLLEVTKLREDELSELVGVIPRHAREQWPDAVAYLESLLGELRAWVDTLSTVTDDTQRVMRDADRAQFDSLFQKIPNFAPLKSYLRGHWYVGKKTKTEYTSANVALRSRYATLIEQVESLVRSFILTAKRGTTTTFNSARMILPDDAQGCVILDATASVNKFYDVASREDGSFTIHRHVPPKGARSYRNVTLHVARAVSTGKGGLTKETVDGATVGAREAERVMSWMASNLDTKVHSKLFVACHKDNGPHFTSITGLPFEHHVGTYGAIDGSNEFRECTAAVVFGLPWRDHIDASLTFFATQGVQEDVWLQSESPRAFKDFNDIREELYLGWVATDLVQTANRCVMRMAINEHGDCAPCALFILLPRGKRGDRLLEILLSQLPGLADVRAWNYEMDGASPKVRTDYAMKLVTILQEIGPREKLVAKYVRERLGCSSTQWERIVQQLRDSKSALALSMAAAGVRYTMERVGSRTVGVFCRD